MKIQEKSGGKQSDRISRGMGTTLFTSCSFSCSWRYYPQTERRLSRFKISVACSRGSELRKRRSVLVSGASLISSSILGFPGDGFAVVKQGLLAGRIPGLSEPDEQGWF